MLGRSFGYLNDINKLIRGVDKCFGHFGRKLDVVASTKRFLDKLLT